MKKNIYENLNIVDFIDEIDLIDTFIDSLDSSIYKDELDFEDMYVRIYGKSDFINDIFMFIVTNYDLSCGYIDFAKDYFDMDYNDIYCLMVTEDGYVCVEKAYSYEGKYLSDGAGIAYVYQEDCKQELIDELLKDGAKVMLFGFTDEDWKDNFNESSCPEEYFDVAEFLKENGCYDCKERYSCDTFAEYVAEMKNNHDKYANNKPNEKSDKKSEKKIEDTKVGPAYSGPAYSLSYDGKQLSMSYDDGNTTISRSYYSDKPLSKAEILSLIDSWK